MRTVTFPTGTHRSTQRVIAAVLRAFDRRSTREWSSANVVRDLRDYIATHLNEHYETGAVSYAVRWIVDNGYGERHVSDGGKRHLSLKLYDNVDLSLSNPPPETWSGYPSQRAPRPTTNGETAPVETEAAVAAASKPPPTTAQPPLPFKPSGRKYRLPELNAALEAWSDADPDAYADWVDAVLAQLKERT